MFSNLRKRLTWLTVLLGLIICVSSLANEVQGARFFQDESKARFVLELTDNASYKVEKLDNPSRIVIDIPHTSLKTDLNDLNTENTVIKTLRTAKHLTYFRLVLDLNQSVKFSHFMLFPTEQYSYRLVLDMHKPTTGWLATTSTAKTGVKVVRAKSTHSKRNIVVLIDPGHGGKDNGAHGPAGTQEKMVVLNIARKVKKLFDAEPGYKAELTRDGDYYIGLRERLNKARQVKADLFVSIHADAFHNARSSGASVYAVSEHGASSEAAHWLAEKENYSELGQVKLDDKTDRLREVLINLSQAMTIAESLSLGKHLLSKIEPFSKLHHDYVEQAPFAVLKSPDIPSVLIETGFISNHAEEQRLKSPRYQQVLAKAIHAGVIDYFKAHPPEDFHNTTVIEPNVH